MFSKISFVAIALYTSAVFAQQVNPNFDQYKQNVINEYQKKQAELQAKYNTAKDAYQNAAEEARHSGMNSSSKGNNGQVISPSDRKVNSLSDRATLLHNEYKSAEAALNSFGADGKAPTVYTNTSEFANDIAKDLKSSSGPKVVGFLGGFSAAGHDADVIKDLNTMQESAKKYFGLEAKGSSYALINGASMDGGINQRFEEALKDGRLKPAVESKNLTNHGAISVNIGEYGGMMTTNKSVLLADSPPKVWEMRTSDKAPSQNPAALAEAAKAAGAGVHIMMAEGSDVLLKEVLQYINNDHKPGTKALIQLGIGYDATNPAKFKGILGASSLARHLALHPELIDTLEKSGIKFEAVDAKSHRLYTSIKDYLKSSDWKTQQYKFAQASKDITSEKFDKNKKILAELEKRFAAETDKNKKKSLTSQIGELNGKITLIETRVNSEAMIEKYVGELSKVSGYKSGSGALERVARASASAVESTRRAGATVDPAAAARSAKAAK